MARMKDILVYHSHGRIGLITPDGEDEHYLAFDVAGQASWQFRFLFPDGRRALLASQEPPRNPHARFDAEDGGAFARTHQWLYEFGTGRLSEVPLASRLEVVALLPGADRFLVCGAMAEGTEILTLALDGSDPESVYRGSGFAYGASLSPEGGRVAYHITGVPGRPGYEIYVVDIQTKEPLLLASDPDYLHFGPLWSPDGQWLLYQRCACRSDPGHDRSDLCISRADGTEHRVLTSGQSHWFCTSYGSPATRGNGSNIPTWSPDGKAVTYTRCLPGARSAWEFQADRPDVDHFNRAYKPELARGGTQICLIDPTSAVVTVLTHDDPPIWNWRTAWSPDARHIAFARAAVGDSPELCVMDADGGKQRFLTRGIDDQGADFPQWVSLATSCEKI
jgi:Tol biopolymer transport system component